MPLLTIVLRGVLADVDHLGAGVGLLEMIRQRNGVKLADAVVALQNAAGIFPGDRRAGLHLGPGDLGILKGLAALGDKVVDAALAGLGVAGIPVLHGGILDRRAGQCDEFHHRRMQLVLIALRRGAAFEVADIRPFVGNDQCAFKLPGILGIDAEIGRQFHRATHALGNVSKRSIRKDGGIQRRERSCPSKAPPCPDTSAPVPGCFCTASEKPQKMIPSSASFF